MDELADKTRYGDQVLALFASPAHLGPPAGANLQGRAENRARGSWLRLYLRAAAGRVEDAGFHALGCPHTVAAAALACDRLAGRNLAELIEYSADFLELALPLPAEKRDIRILVEDAVRDAARGRR